MATMAALRGGAGQVRLLAASSIHLILAVKLVEAEVACIPDGGIGALGADAYNAVREHMAWGTVGVVGPGLGRHPSTWHLVHRLAAGSELPLVIDADGLNALAENQELLGRLGDHGHVRVLTPHPGEMARLVQTTTDEVQARREDLAVEAARRWGAVVALKGAHTVVAAPNGRVSTDPHAVPALATGGTGDVLAGLIAALLAQGSDAFEATVTGVFVHAASGRAAARGSSGLLASEVASAIPDVMERLREMGR
jgi:NAD(P)H-hydrate epimerase